MNRGIVTYTCRDKREQTTEPKLHIIFKNCQNYRISSLDMESPWKRIQSTTIPSFGLVIHEMAFEI